MMETCCNFKPSVVHAGKVKFIQFRDCLDCKMLAAALCVLAGLPSSRRPKPRF